jgi:hypothetical protein
MRERAKSAAGRSILSLDLLSISLWFMYIRFYVG